MRGHRHRNCRSRAVVSGLVAVLAACLLTLDGCTGPGDSANDRAQTGIEGHGTGSFMFSGAAAVRDHPIRVRYIAPEGDLSTAEILFVIPGASRDAEGYEADWEPLVKGHHVLVIIPTFDEQDYPVDAYNLGNLVDGDGDPNPPDQWSFTVIDALFDHVVADVHSQAKDFMMFGHSAGAQFVHRLIEFAPDRVRAAVAANAGWYTMPDDSENFPYGLDGIPTDEEDLGDSYAANLTVLLGADDIDPNDSKLRHDDGSDAQGSTRLERGLSFYLAARKSADAHSMDFRWHLVVVPGIAHDHTEMAREAAPILLGGN